MGFEGPKGVCAFRVASITLLLVCFNPIGNVSCGWRENRMRALVNSFERQSGQGQDENKECADLRVDAE